MEHKPLITIGISGFNAASFIAETIASVEKQDFTNYEILFIDDGSTDGTVDVVKRLQNQFSNIRVYPSKQNHGTIFEYNKLISLMNGQYLLYLDHDDYLANGVLSSFSKAIQQINNPHVIISGNYEIKKADSSITKKRIITRPDFLTRDQALFQILTEKIDFLTFGRLFPKSCLYDGIFSEGEGYDDISTLYKIVNNSQGVYQVPFDCYITVERSGSASRISKQKNNQNALLSYTKMLQFASANCPKAVSFLRWKISDFYAKTIATNFFENEKWITTKRRLFSSRKFLFTHLFQVLFCYRGYATNKFGSLLLLFAPKIYCKKYVARVTKGF